MEDVRSGLILEYLLKVGPIGFSNGFDVECERKRGIKNGSTFLT